MPYGIIQDNNQVILTVDDEQFMLDTVRDALQEAGFTVVEATDGASAIARFKEFSPDLVLLDLVMPGMDGFATCQGIRSLPEGIYTPILMVTGLDDAESINHAFEAGATDFTTKTIKTELLIFRIRYMLRASRSIKNLEKSEARLANAQRIAHLGNWEWEPSTGGFWGSEETFRILGREKHHHRFSFSELLVALNPPDRVIAESHLKNVVLNGSGCAFECRIRHTGEKLRRVRLQAWADTENSGKTPRIMGTIHDITELKQSEDRLLLLKEAVDSLPIGITICDIHGKISYVNNTEAEMHGYKPDELLGREARGFAPIHLRTTSSQDEICNAEVWRRESVNLRGDGTEFPVQLSSIAVRNADDVCLGIVTACEDISGRKEVEKKIYRLAYFDSLTGLPNRGTFLDRLSHALALGRREGHQVGLLFLDLDNFKDVNDTRGHDFGDKLLREVAIRFADVMRESDTLARLGGDEFVVVLTSLNGQESAATAAQRVLSIFSEPFVVDGIKISSSASIGIALYPDDGADAETLFQCADIAMYHAKAETRSHYRFFSADMNEQTMRRVALENALRQGVEKNEFALHYQPQWDLTTRKMVGVEALLRWESTDFGMLQPSEFIPLAEKSGLIIGLGEWVLRTACAQARNWSMDGHRDLKVAINISGKQLNQLDFLPMVERIMEETGVSPEIIELEFTESIFMGNTERTIDIFRTLKKMGFHISIDDFGTGYSSLSYLKHFPIDRIKIDRSFITDVNQSAEDAAIAEAIISLAHGLNLKVMAEGVETAAQMNFLTACNCDEIQGFYLAQPMTATDLVENFRVWNHQERAGDYSGPQLIESSLSLGRPAVHFAHARQDSKEKKR